MKFSVLMSVYYNDKPEYLKEALDSILAQTLTPSQVVLVKDGKITKEIYDVIEDFRYKFPSIDILCLVKNSGLGYALQKGISMCKYDIVARVDSDDINKPDRFEKQINYLKNHENVAVVGGQIHQFYDEGEEKVFVSKRIVPLTYDNIKSYSNSRNPLNHMAVMFRKDAILASGNYMTSIGFEDYYLWLRVLKNGYMIENLDDVLVDVRVGKEMIERRGGMKYAFSAVHTKRMFYKEDLINIGGYLKSALASLVVGCSPVFIREKIYYKFLHKKMK